MQRVAEVAPELVDELAETGARFTHHSSIAPTGTISLSLANNASNGIEPSLRPPLQPQRDPRRQEVQGKGRRLRPTSCWPTASWSTRRRCRSPRTPKASCRTTSSPPTTSRPRSTSTSRPPRRSGWTRSISKTANVPDRLPVRGLQGHLPLRPRAGPEGLHHVPLQPGRLPGRAGQGSGPGEHPVPLRARGRHA